MTSTMSNAIDLDRMMLRKDKADHRSKDKSLTRVGCFTSYKIL